MHKDDEKIAEMRRSMFITLKNEGFHAVAALIDAETMPGKINGVQPDLIGFNEKGIGVVVQVETCETVRSTEAEERLSSLIMVQAEEHEYRLLVPTECMDSVVEWVKKLGLDEDIVWEYF
ncbi:MAG: hypothetical protein M1351_05665 [Candidatus Thermoplasmatota archaeon]|nr:hypothetical protein [Candidatus Sysuiplasma jiujiangense]MCL5253556.1 hypothetical protein [Candidatus Thermoplasmatota archaeon]